MNEIQFFQRFIQYRALERRFGPGCSSDGRPGPESHRTLSAAVSSALAEQVEGFPPTSAFRFAGSSKSA
jgi:hypothetical protein